MPDLSADDSVPVKQASFVYLLRCRDGSLYCGWTNNLERRLKAHQAGKGSKYTRSRLPVEMIWWASCEDRSQAMRAEARIKRMKKQQKLQLAETPPGLKWLA